MLKHLVVAALSAGLVACGGTEPAPEAQQPKQATMDGREVVSVSAMLAASQDGQVVVDMRNTNLGFRVEKGVDYSAITVICPSSRVMNMEKWLPELASQFQKSPADLKQGFTMFPYMAPEKGSVTQQSAPTCTDSEGNICDSEREPDGSWTCFCSV
ncbi:MAG: hypothetical protein JXB05_23600 [Myxococcaceae bacterium]|nr:hypothetical protein [Myxococcaceae bacterium]